MLTFPWRVPLLTLLVPFAIAVPILHCGGSHASNAEDAGPDANAGATDATLSALTISAGPLSPTFAPSTSNYSAMVSSAVTSLTVTPTVHASGATAQVRVGTGTFASVASGTASSALGLNTGSNEIDIKVTASNGTTTNTYVVLVARATALAFTNGQAASTVVGQSSFTTSASGVGSNALNAPAGLSIAPNGSLLIADTNNSRVLVYTTPPSVNGASATLVVGQSDFTSNTGSTTPAGLTNPVSARADNTQLYVSDTGNNRVLVYPTPSMNGPSASIAVGSHSTADAGSGICTVASFIPRDCYPFVSAGDAGLLVLAATRALIFEPVPTASDADASAVLAQSSFTTCAGLDGGTDAGDGGVGELIGASSVWTNGTFIAIANTGKNNVEIWTTFPSQNRPPDVTLSADNASGGVALSAPQGITSNGVQLYVADTGNNRVLVWNVADLTTNAAVATAVIGQTTFGGTTAATTATGLSAPKGVAVDATQLYVSDSGNNRVLVFAGQ